MHVVHVLTHIRRAAAKEVSACPCSRRALAVQGRHGRAWERTDLAFTSSSPLQGYPECRYILCTVATIADVVLDTNGLLRRGFSVVYSLNVLPKGFLEIWRSEED